MNENENINEGKKEIASKGYMEGRFITGAGHAHECCGPHTAVFGCKMYGTFNIWLSHGRVDEFSPTIVTEKKAYWFLSITRGEDVWFGWAIRDHSSRQAMKTLEVLTKEPLPKILKDDMRLRVNIYEKWSDKKITSWAKDKYWFQTFPFSPKKRADSSFIWDKINVIDWSGLSVLDIGCHYGYHSFKASESGAIVTGVERDKKSLDAARVIQKYIIQQDIGFVKKIPESKKFDVILYLSVHHQIDSAYEILRSRLKELRDITNKHLFVELIMPPVFPLGGKMEETEVDKIVKGRVLARYKHKVRGHRKIYWIEK